MHHSHINKLMTTTTICAVFNTPEQRTTQAPKVRRKYFSFLF